MPTRAAQRRGSAPLSTQLPTGERLLHNVTDLEEVENRTTLLLQELLKRKPSFRPAGVEKQGLSARRQILHIQQATHSHHPHTQSYDSQHSRTRKSHHLHSMDHAETHFYPNDPLPAQASCASLVNQCAVWHSSGLICSGELLDHLAIASKGNMALPALCNKRPPSRKLSSSASKRAQRASLRHETKKSATFSAQFSPAELGIIDSLGAGRKMATSMCAQANKGVPANHVLTEKQRREYLNEKYQVLRSLIPNPTKADRASIVQDAIDHVNELKECVEKLQLEVGSRDLKRRKVVDDGMDYGKGRGKARSCDTEQHLSTGSKGCWDRNMCIQAQMTSAYGTEIDVRIMDDEATIKVTHHQSQDNFLLIAALMLHEARLELLHANGTRIGNHHVYMLNVKIAEGKDVGAAHIAKQLLERFDAYHASASC